MKAGYQDGAGVEGNEGYDEVALQRAFDASFMSTYKSTVLNAHAKGHAAFQDSKDNSTRRENDTL